MANYEKSKRSNNLIYIGIKQALFIAERMKEEFVFNMAKAEGNSLTFAETQTVMTGFGVSGRPIKDINQVRHIQKGWEEIIQQVKNNIFSLDRLNFILINELVSRDENPESGEFRQKQVLITGTKYVPTLPMLLRENFQFMIDSFMKNNQIESSFDLFLDTARNQFFGDGNKRTGQLMMNGVLMLNGFAPFTYPPERDEEFRDKILRFYETGEKKEMSLFIISCINDKRYLILQEPQPLPPETELD